MITNIIHFFLNFPYNEIIAEGKMCVHNTNQARKKRQKSIYITILLHIIDYIM